MSTPEVDVTYTRYQAAIVARQVEQTQVVAAGAAPTADLDDFNINTSYPFPQDMPLGKVATVVDLVHAGDATDQDLAWSLDLSKQQGNYAANAAAYLGLVHRDRDTTPNTLTLTPEGEKFRELTPGQRLAVLKHLVGEMAHDDVSDRGYSDSTTEYRQGTAARWAARVEAEGAEASLSESTAAAVTRSREQSRPPRERVRRSEPVYTVCQGCFMALPATGVCSNCD